MNRGYIRIWRKLEDSGILSSAELCKLFIFLMIKTVYKSHKVIVGSQVIHLQPGQLFVGRKQLARELCSTERKIRTSLSVLQKMEIIDQHTTSRGTIISLINLSKYQNDECLDDQHKAHIRQTDDPHVTTKQECKNKKKEECVFNAREREEAPEGDASGLSGKAGASSRQPSLAFEEFFDAYPERHRGGRLEAQAEWGALEANRALPGLPRLLDALGQWEDSEAWKRQGGRYVPSAANFLKREYWLRKPPEPEERGGKGEQARPRANTVAQQQTRDNDDMAKMLLQARRTKHAQSELHASIAGQSGPALPAGR